MPETILRVGLTGNIAAGKSTVAAWLAEMGCHVVDADRLGHECLEPSAPTYGQVLEVFGSDILADDGSVDRGLLGAIVFEDPAALEKLESILHPGVRDREREFMEALEAAGTPAVAVTEAALLYETGRDKAYHRMVVVTAPYEVRLGRLRAKGLSAADARARIGSQMEQRKKEELADYVIDNGRSRELARSLTEALFAHLLTDLETLVAGVALGTSDRVG